MKAGSATLKALLATGKFYMADLYTITLQSGLIIRWTNFDIPLTYAGNVYTPFALDRKGTTESCGLSVDDLDVMVHLNADDKLNGQSILYMMHVGEFDNAVCTLDVAFMPLSNPTDLSAGVVRKFLGNVDFDELDGVGASMKVHHFTQKLNMTIPRNLYMPTCKNTLFDSMCGLHKENFAKSGTVQAGSTQSSIVSSVLSVPDTVVENIISTASFRLPLSEETLDNNSPTSLYDEKHDTGYRLGYAYHNTSFAVKFTETKRINKIVIKTAYDWQDLIAVRTTDSSHTLLGNLKCVRVDYEYDIEPNHVYTYELFFTTPLQVSEFEIYHTEPAYILEIEVWAVIADYPTLNLGTITFTSGANTGLTRTIKSTSGDTIFLAQNFPYTINVGDTFTAYPGCTKTIDVCSNVFFNSLRFRGYPFVPTSEVLI